MTVASVQGVGLFRFACSAKLKHLAVEIFPAKTSLQAESCKKTKENREHLEAPKPVANCSQTRPRLLI